MGMWDLLVYRVGVFLVKGGKGWISGGRGWGVLFVWIFVDER
jgi:hypothetical protein